VNILDLRSSDGREVISISKKRKVISKKREGKTALNGKTSRTNSTKR